MGQHWQVLNVDRKEKKIVVARVAKLGNLFLEDLRGLYQSLRVPCLPKDVDKWLSRGNLVTQQGPIGRLSTEVLDMIFKALLHDAGNLEDRSWATIDCLAFAVCCKQLLTIGKRHILRTLMSRYARDVDCRLVCLGEYARADDQAPTGMLTDGELKEIETAEVSDEEDKFVASVSRQSLYGFSATHYQGRDWVNSTVQKPFKSLRYEYRHVHKMLGPSLDVMLDSDMQRVTALGGTDCHCCPYPDGPNVLCNVSKYEYILEEKLVDLQNARGRVTLAHALLSRICYSPIQSVSIPCDAEYADRLAKGPWAGDRFRITTMNELPVLKDGKEWRDVTEEANLLLCHLWSRIPETEDDFESEAGNDAAVWLPLSQNSVCKTDSDCDDLSDIFL